MYLKLLVLLCMLTAILVAPLSAIAQPALDPTPYFPTDDELPEGFLTTGQDRDDAPGLATVQREYVRFNPEVAEDDVTLMAILISVADTPARAREAYREAEVERTWVGFTVEPLGEALGEEVMVARMNVGPSGRTDGEIVDVFFRSGRFNVGVTWLDYVDLPNLEDALEMARMIEAKLPS
jgi:hypothetical protein